MNRTSKRWLAPAALSVAGAAVFTAGWFGHSSGLAREAIGRGGAGHAGAADSGSPSVPPSSVSIADGATGVSPDSTVTVDGAGGAGLQESEFSTGRPDTAR